MDLTIHDFHGGAAGSFASEGCADCPPGDDNDPAIRESEYLTEWGDGLQPFTDGWRDDMRGAQGAPTDLIGDDV